MRAGMPEALAMKIPVTPAVRFLKSKGVDLTPHIFNYIEKGGTGHSAEALGVDEHSVIKTLIFETSEGKPVAVLMHGDREVSEKNLARHLGVKSAAPASADKAGRWTGYVFGGTSPFGLRTKMPILVEATIFDLDRIYINGGKRGFLVEIDPEALAKALDVEKVNLAI
jgi:Cys-tRNA(Pro) deacylase